MQVVYRPGIAKGAAYFVSRQDREEAAIRSGEDDLQAVLVTLRSDPDLEPILVEVRCHLSDEEIREKDPNPRRGILRASESFLVSNEELFRRTTLGPEMVLQRSLRTQELETFHDRIGYWNS